MKREYDKNIMDQINKKEIDTLVNIMHNVWKIVKILLIISIIVGFILFLMVAFLFKDQYSPDLLTELERKYNEKFIVISQIEKENHINLYKISPKNNKNIIFNAYQRISTIQDDYRETAIKYYLEKFEIENVINGLEKKEDIYSLLNNNEVKFLTFDFWININSYEDIEQATTDIYNINKYISQYVKNDAIFTLSQKIKFNNYVSPVNYRIKYVLEDLIYEEKYYYINYLKENNLNLSAISNTDIYTIWKPRKLKIIVDGNILENTNNTPLVDNSFAIYNPKTKEYDISLINILENTNNIEKITNKNGTLEEIRYNKRKYTINKDDKDSLSNESNTKILKEILKVNIEYDYYNHKLYIFF